MGVVAAQLIAQVSTSGVDKTKSDLESVGQSVNDTSGAMKTALGGAALAAGAAIVAIGVKSVQMAGTFQSGMTSLVTGAGESADVVRDKFGNIIGGIKMVSDGILDMAVKTGTSTQQLTDGMYMIESAGFHGAAGLSVLQAAAEGAKVGNADLGVVAGAVTTVMHDYASSHISATQATNALITTVASGKTHMQDLSNSLAAILPLASSLHIPFEQVAGAVATMTNAGMPAQQATQNLAFAVRALNVETPKGADALKQFGLSAAEVHNTLTTKGLPATLQMIETQIGKQFPISSMKGQQALKDIMGGAVGLNVALMVGGDHMKEYTTDINSIGSTLKSGSKDVQGWSDVQNNFNFKIAQAQEVIETLGIKLGTALLPIVGKAVDAFSNLATWIGKNVDPINTLIPILAGLGAVVAGTLVPAFAAWAIEVVAATWPILLIAAAVAGLVAVFMHFYQTSAPFRDFINGIGKAFQQLGSAIWSGAMPILQAIGKFLISTFTPVWQQIVSVINGQVKPAWNSLIQALTPILPELKAFGAVIAGVVVVALMLFISSIAAVVKAFAGMLSGIATIIGGVITIFTGMVQVISGIIALIVDLVTGHFDKLGTDLQTIVGGYVKMFSGLWQVIQGIFQAAIGVVVGLVTGFWSTLTGIFKGISDELVGHSIIPDMINSIVSWFQQLPGRAMGAISSLAGSIGGFFSNLAGQAMTWGSDLVNGIASGITSSIGAVTSAASNVASAIASILHHSKPEIGPLAHDDEWMPHMMSNLAEGINQNLGKIKSASLNIATTIANPNSQSSFAGPSTGGLGGLSVVPSSVSQGATPINITVQSAPVYLDGKALASGLMNPFVNTVRSATGTFNY